MAATPLSASPVAIPLAREHAADPIRKGKVLSTNEASPTITEPARFKLGCFVWLAIAVGCFVAAVVGWVALQTLVPAPPIAVSRQTTYITEPLGPDGLPNYKRYVLEKYRDGATPENNAAVLLWQAAWPGDLEALRIRRNGQRTRLEGNSFGRRLADLG